MTDAVPFVAISILISLCLIIIMCVAGYAFFIVLREEHRDLLNSKPNRLRGSVDNSKPTHTYQEDKRLGKALADFAQVIKDHNLSDEEAIGFLKAAAKEVEKRIYRQNS